MAAVGLSIDRFHEPIDAGLFADWKAEHEREEKKQRPWVCINGHDDDSRIVDVGRAHENRLARASKFELT
jgi:hypothetical protein